MIEVIQGPTQADTIKALSVEMNDGRVNKWEKSAHPSNNNLDKLSECVYSNTVVNADVSFPTSFWTQFNILLGRKLLQTRRNLSMLYIQLAHHLVSGALLGGIYWGVGNDAKFAIANFKFCLSCLVFFMYTYVMIPVLICKYFEIVTRLN